MEKIFKDSKADVINNGFLERVMENVASISPPARTIYRTPTLLATVVTVVAIAMITLTVGVDTLSKKYKEWSVSIVHSDIKVEKLKHMCPIAPLNNIRYE